LLGLRLVELVHERHVVEPVGQRAEFVYAAHEPDLQLLYVLAHHLLVADHAHLLVLVEKLFKLFVVDPFLLLLFFDFDIFLFAVEFHVLFN